MVVFLLAAITTILFIKFWPQFAKRLLKWALYAIAAMAGISVAIALALWVRESWSHRGRFTIESVPPQIEASKENVSDAFAHLIPKRVESGAGAAPVKPVPSEHGPWENYAPTKVLAPDGVTYEFPYWVEKGEIETLFRAHFGQPPLPPLPPGFALDNPRSRLPLPPQR